MKRTILHIIGLFLVLLFLTDCSTEKNTRASRAFHNVTSKYNILFNAKESVKSGVEKIDETIENDFTKILPVYKASDPSVANLVISDMETAIIKGSKLIELHSITKKPKRRRRRTRKYQEFAKKEEFNKYVDDAYLVMGKANYYQQNYNNAISNFNHIIRHFPELDTKYEAYVWLIRSYSELERYTEASEVIKETQADRDFPKKLERDLALASADFYLKQSEYDNTIKFLNIAIQNTFWKKNKARYQYIIAQLYEELGQYQKALEAYKAVTKMNPDYNMAFNAKINAAGVFSGEGDPKAIRKQLNKMLRDKKNIDFRDQIYFALGNLDMKQGLREDAIENYRKSVATSFQNQFQRSQSAITLADLYFEDLEYKKAQAYYDSAMILINEDYPNYADLAVKYKSLTQLTDYLHTVEREDSLQKVANMPAKEREALIAGLIQAEQKRQKEMQMAGMQGRRNSGYYRANRYRMGMGRNQGSGGWYFYNPQTITYGKNQFTQRWGRRKLEDNWRRSNKNEISIDEYDELAVIDSTDMVQRVEDPLKKEFYTQYLPLTDSMMEISNNKIRDALYNAGRIFKTDFSNYNRSAETFINLNERYPDNIYLLSAYFNLYDLYELMGNKERSNYYRNLIINQFPESKYAQYLVNPNFFAELEEHNNKLNQYYEELYYQFKEGNYNRINSTATKIKEMKPDSAMLSKVEFLSTIAQGNQDGVHQFENYLQDYLSTFPKAEPVPLAKQILSLIQDSTLTDYQKLVEIGYINEKIQNVELLDERDRANDEFGGKFSYEPDLLHYFVIAYPLDGNVDLNRLKFDIANYNIDHYTKIDFDIETENLNDKIGLVLVRVIENKESALIYHRAIIRKAPVFKTLKDVDFYNFVISSTNYRQLLDDQSLADYLKFFVKNYSRFIQSDFSDDEYDISPEELMAKAKEEAKDQERGEYVVVDTNKGSIYASDINKEQYFVLAVKDLDVSTRNLRKGFTDFNRAEFKTWNLKTTTEKDGDYQLIIIGEIQSLNESMSYFRKVVTTRSLFRPLGRTTYRNFLITQENLDILMDKGDADSYLQFFRTNYIQRPTSSSSSSSNTSNDEKTTTAAKVEKDKEPVSDIYSENTEGEHKFVFVIPRENIDKTTFVNNIKEYNVANYGDLNIQIEESNLDDFRQLVTLSGFKDKASATRYFKTIVQNRDLYAPLGKASYRNFLISNANYTRFLEDKNIKTYVDFYKKAYLNK